MKVCILGYTGFIGQNLLLAIANSYGVSLREENWREKISDAEIIINLIGKAHDHHEKASYQDFYGANVEILKKVFQAFLQSDAQMIIHISSVAAVEEFNAKKKIEETDHANPISHYAKTKKEAEDWLIQQKLPQDKKLIILRPPMIHGKGDKGSLRTLYSLIYKGIPYPFSSFDNNRSFICMDNFIFFIQQIIAKKDQIKSGIYHIADDEIISTQKIIEIIKKVENKPIVQLEVPKFAIEILAKIGDFLPIPINTKKLRKMTGTLCVSNKKIKKELGIQKLPFSAEEGLFKTIKTFKNDKNS